MSKTLTQKNGYPSDVRACKCRTQGFSSFFHPRNGSRLLSVSAWGLNHEGVRSKHGVCLVFASRRGLDGRPTAVGRGPLDCLTGDPRQRAWTPVGRSSGAGRPSDGRPLDVVDDRAVDCRVVAGAFTLLKAYPWTVVSWLEVLLF